MHTIGEVVGTQRSREGDLCVIIAINDDPSDLEKLEKLQGQKATVDIKKYSEKRSLSANSYLWHLCDEIGKKLKADKETIYIWMIRDAGVMDQYELPVAEIDKISQFYRYTEIDHTFTEEVWREGTPDPIEIEKASIRCYKGSHTYSKKEMSDLIDRAVEEAKNQGIDTLLKEELDNLIDRWDSRE